jgi:hypothetical protein
MFDDDKKQQDDAVEDIFDGLDKTNDSDTAAGDVPENLPFADTPEESAPQAEPTSSESEVTPQEAEPNSESAAPASDLEAQPIPETNAAQESIASPQPEIQPDSESTPLPPSSATSMPMQAPKKRKGGSTGITLLIIFLVLATVSLGVYIAYVLVTENPFVTQEAIEVPVEDELPVNDEDVSDDMADPEPVIEEVEEEPDDTDTDLDGLSDAEEDELGTDPTLIDTDGDGLADREEVRVYSTDPLNEDTDEDGFLDGEEVENGYSPNGDGRLFQVPQKN